MASIVLELQKAAMDPKTAITDLLRQALVTAKKLKIKELETWINSELKGYAGQEPPPYRTVRGEVRAWNPYHGWIPVIFESTEHAQMLNRRSVGQAISELEHLLKNSAGRGLQINFPTDIENELMASSPGGQLKPTLHVSTASLHGIIEVVRDIVLNWALKLEEEGILGEGFTFSKGELEAASQATHHVNNFFGNVTQSQFQQDSPGSTQSMVTSSAGLEALSDFLNSARKVLDATSAGTRKAELEAEIITLEAQASSPAPKGRIIKEGLNSVRTILEGAGGALAAEALSKLPSLFHLF